MSELEYMSYSRINAMMTCPLRFQFRYVDRLEPEFTAPALVFGTAIHSAIADHYRTSMEDESPPTHDELMSSFDKSWREASVDRPPIKFKEKENVETLHDLASSMLARFREEASPSRVVGVEVPFRVPLDDSIDLVGVVDLVEVDEEGQLTLVDHKTSARRYADGQAQDSIQLGVYALAAEEVTGQAETLVRFDVLLKSKNGQGGMQRQYGVRSPGDTARVRQIALKVAEAIEAGVFYPNPSWMCAGCEFRSTCDRWDG